MVERVVPLRPGAHVLDLCCGHWRHLRLLRRMGYAALGVDLSREQIGRARRAAWGGPCPIARADVRTLPFRAGFDAVISLDGSFGYFSDEDNFRHLGETARVLRRGGRLVLDLQNPARVVAVRPRRVLRDPVTGGRVVEEFQLDRGARRVYGRKELRLGDICREYFFVLRYYEPPELVALLTAQGLEVKAVFGDYDLTAYSKSSPRLIVVADKR